MVGSCTLNLISLLIWSLPAQENYRHIETPHYPELARAAGVQGEAKVSATVDGNGKVTNVEAAGERAVLRDAAVANVQKWTFEPNFSGSRRYEVFYVFVLREGRSELPSEEVPFDFEIPHVVRVVANSAPGDSNLQPDIRVLSHDPIRYPPLARQTRVQGSVKLFAIVDHEGKLAELDIDSGNRLLTGNAVENLRTWKFEPPKRGAAAFTVTYEYVLRDADDKSTVDENTFDPPRSVRIVATPPTIESATISAKHLP